MCPSAGAGCGALHATEAREARVVLVDGAPVLPCLAHVVCLGLVLEQVRNFAHQCAERIGGHVHEEGEEGIDELGGCESTSLIRGDVVPEGVDFVSVVAEKIGSSFDDGTVADEARAFFG